LFKDPTIFPVQRHVQEQLHHFIESDLRRQTARHLVPRYLTREHLPWGIHTCSRAILRSVPNFNIRDCPKQYWTKALKSLRFEEDKKILRCLKQKTTIPETETNRILAVNLERRDQQGGVLSYLKKRETIISPRPFSVLYQPQWEDRVTKAGAALVEEPEGVVEDEVLTKRIKALGTPIKRLK